MPLSRSVFRRDAEQPADGFYHPATLVKDAQRHGLRVLPIDVTQSDWDCTVDPARSLRIGLRYIRGLWKRPGEPSKPRATITFQEHRRSGKPGP